MFNQSQEAIEAAIGWVIRLRHATVRDWEEFTCWLEADPRHLQAYEEVSAADEVVDALPPKAVEPIVVAPVGQAGSEPRSRRTILAWSLAASVAIVVGYSSFNLLDDSYAVETVPGERRVVPLADGSRIELNGETRIILKRGTPRYARLERGEAVFNVLHDQSSPFQVQAGEAEIEDIGTVFNVRRANEVIAVEVAEGEVAVVTGGQRAHLSAGMTFQADGDQLTRSRRDPASIGEWKRGLLSYSSASYEQIAQDLFRNTGLTVQVDPQLRGRRFSGVILLGPDKPALMRRVSALLMVEARPNGEGWLLVPGAR